MKRTILFIILILTSISTLYADVNNKLSLSSFKCNQTLHNKYMDICFDYSLNKLNNLLKLFNLHSLITNYY